MDWKVHVPRGRRTADLIARLGREPHSPNQDNRISARMAVSPSSFARGVAKHANPAVDFPVPRSARWDETEA